MPSIEKRFPLMLLIAFAFDMRPALPQTGTSRRPPPSRKEVDFCTSAARCFTPARGPECPKVRFGWGNCPGSRQACDWCYGPNGVFAYSPRSSTYTLDSGCNRLGKDTTWSTKDPQVLDWMKSAGGTCTSNGRGVYSCTKIDPARFREIAKCAR
jgi:hypothetical protein